MSAVDRFACQEMLTEIGKQEDAHIFADPVDWKGLWLPEYPILIKEPMDFGTIEARHHFPTCSTHSRLIAAACTV